MFLTLFCTVAAALATAAIGSNARAIGTTLGLLDYPDDAGGRKLHAGVTPLVGGLALALAVVAAVIITIVAGPDRGAGVDRDLARLALGVGAMFVIGVADDRFELSVRVRLAVASAVLLGLVATVPDFALDFVRFGADGRLLLLGGLVLPFTLLCLVGLLNAVNMADGKNGIVIGLALIWSAFLLRHLPPVVLPVMAAVTAALAVLFVFNLRGRLFLGDGGSYAVSALFGLLAIEAYNHAFAEIGAEDIAILFALPVFDTLRLVVTRLRQRKSPFHGGRDHFHHYLYARVGWPRGLYIYLTLAAVPVAGAALWPGSGFAWLAGALIAYGAVLVWAQLR